MPKTKSKEKKAGRKGRIKIKDLSAKDVQKVRGGVRKAGKDTQDF